MAWVNGVWQESNQKPESQKPTQTVSQIFDSAMEDREAAAFSSLDRSASWAESGQPAWTARSTESDRAAVQVRARTIARRSGRGNDFDHWLQATVELHIAKRAEEISRLQPGRGALDDWLRAEREVLTQLRAAEIAKSPQAGGDTDNWLQAEREVLIAQRAREIAALPGRGA